MMISCFRPTLRPVIAEIVEVEKIWTFCVEFLKKIFRVKADGNFFGSRYLGFGILRILIEVDSEILDKNDKWRTKGL